MLLISPESKVNVPSFIFLGIEYLMVIDNELLSISSALDEILIEATFK